MDDATTLAQHQACGNADADKPRRRKHLYEVERHPAERMGVDDPATPEQSKPRRRLLAEQPKDPLGFGYAWRRASASSSLVFCRERPRADRRPGHLVQRRDTDVLEAGFCHQLDDPLPRPVMRDPRQHLIEYDRSQMGEVEARE